MTQKGREANLLARGLLVAAKIIVQTRRGGGEQERAVGRCGMVKRTIILPFLASAAVYNLFSR